MFGDRLGADRSGRVRSGAHVFGSSRLMFDVCPPQVLVLEDEAETERGVQGGGDCR